MACNGRLSTIGNKTTHRDITHNKHTGTSRPSYPHPQRPANYCDNHGHWQFFTYSPKMIPQLANTKRRRGRRRKTPSLSSPGSFLLLCFFLLSNSGGVVESFSTDAMIVAPVVHFGINTHVRHLSVACRGPESLRQVAAACQARNPVVRGAHV